MKTADMIIALRQAAHKAGATLDAEHFPEMTSSEPASIWVPGKTVGFNFNSYFAWVVSLDPTGDAPHEYQFVEVERWDAVDALARDLGHALTNTDTA